MTFMNHTKLQDRQSGTYGLNCTTTTSNDMLNGRQTSMAFLPMVNSNDATVHNNNNNLYSMNQSILAHHLQQQHQQQQLLLQQHHQQQQQQQSISSHFPSIHSNTLSNFPNEFTHQTQLQRIQTPIQQPTTNNQLQTPPSYQELHEHLGNGSYQPVLSSSDSISSTLIPSNSGDLQTNSNSQFFSMGFIDDSDESYQNSSDFLDSHTLSPCLLTLTPTGSFSNDLLFDQFLWDNTNNESSNSVSANNVGTVQSSYLQHNPEPLVLSDHTGSILTNRSIHTPHNVRSYSLGNDTPMSSSTNTPLSTMSLEEAATEKTTKRLRNAFSLTDLQDGLKSNNGVQLRMQDSWHEHTHWHFVTTDEDGNCVECDNEFQKGDLISIGTRSIEVEEGLEKSARGPDRVHWNCSRFWSRRKDEPNAASSFGELISKIIGGPEKMKLLSGWSELDVDSQIKVYLHAKIEVDQQLVVAQKDAQRKRKREVLEEYRVDDLDTKSFRDLQYLAKKLKIKANQKKSDLILNLKTILTSED